MQDDSVVLLTCTREEARHIDETNDWNVEGIAEADETGTLARGVAVEHTSELRRLVGNDTHGTTVEAREADDDVLGMAWLHLEELAVIDCSGNDLIHVVCLVWIVRN